MSEGLTSVTALVAFAVVLAVGAKLGAGSPATLVGLFPPCGARDWPTGVQEPDAPHFVFAGPPAPARPSAADPAGEARPPEIVELYAGLIR